MNPLRRHPTLAFNTSIIVNLGALCLPPITPLASRKTHPKTSLATPRHRSPHAKTLRLPHKTDPRSALRRWHANSFLKDRRRG
jgi:hypothetical protein